jgi:hypothetical protein
MFNIDTNNKKPITKLKSPTQQPIQNIPPPQSIPYLLKNIPINSKFQNIQPKQDVNNPIMIDQNLIKRKRESDDGQEK